MVTNRPGVSVCPGDEYDDRGENEDRNKELKYELCCDCLSDHRHMVNPFRVTMHCVATNLLVRLRQVAEVKSPTGELAIAEIPLKAETAVKKRLHYNTRRWRRDPFGEGHACT